MERRLRLHWTALIFQTSSVVHSWPYRLNCAISVVREVSRANAGFAAQAAATGQGALGSLAKSAGNFAPELAQDIEKILPES